MTSKRKNGIRMALAGATVAGLTMIALPSPAQAATGYVRCNKGDICFFSGYDGGGKMCAWTGNDTDWQKGAEKCSWSKSTKVKSVYNRGYSGGKDTVVYYKKAGQKKQDRGGCTTPGKKGNFQAAKYLRSHKWVTSC
ncbi:peptidase inhibitor family I36 protein [Streptomyces sp. NPDC058001]|uniref:peptidase inhibitor family I36 protein n=1 Tax=Streptomyces sp. NPDC058001 TaxID=3346300 RepID=UPI0036E98EAE